MSSVANWADDEWAFCLSCYFHNATEEEALELYAEYYERSKTSIHRKFKKEGICIKDYIGSGIGSNKITKQHLIKELKQVYKILEEPFSAKQFNELAGSDSETVIGCFGSWKEAIKAAGLVKKFNSHKQIENEIIDFDPAKEVKKNWKKQKEKLVKKAEERQIKQLRTQAHKLDVVKQMIEESIANASPLTVNVASPEKKKKVSKKKEKIEKENCSLWFEFSDLQLGTYITDEEMGGINKHNWVVWQSKLDVWKMEAIRQIKSYDESHKIDRIVLAMLGDMVEGQDIFKGQVWQIDRNVVDQAIDGANDTSAAFAEIMLTFPHLHFDILEVFGNHGRIGRKGDSPYACSMDKIYQRMLESQLKGVTGLKNYRYHRNEAWFYFVEFYGWNHLLLHGDQGMSSMWSSRPTVNGLEKGLVRYNQMFQQQVHFLHCGHFHSPVNWSFNISQILINGSFIGTSTFSATKMVASSPAVQLMYVFKPRVGLDITHRLYLTLDNVMKPIKPRSFPEEEEVKGS
jgi:hypothetical protein